MWGRLVENSVVMVRSVSGLVVASLTVVMLATGCGGASSSPAVIHHTTSTTHHVLLTTEKVTVSPRTGIRDGQQVRVSVQDFKPGEAGIKFFLSECATPMQVNHLGCGMQLALQPFGLTDSNGDGSGSVSFTVHSSAATQPLSSALVPCSGLCVIVATTGAQGDYGFAPISFAG